MSIIDLSHNLISGDLVLDGEQNPKLEEISNIKAKGYAVTLISIHSHTGTHIDAPSHMIEGAKTLTSFPISKYYGQGMMIQCKEFANKEIPLSYLQQFEESISKAEFIILNTGWDQKWNTLEYFKNFPVLSEESASWLSRFNLKGIGIDSISIDHIDSQTTPIHKILLSNEILIIENLTNLNELTNKSFNFQCMPIKFKDIEGSPVRAVAHINEA
jgi:arylformamidase